MALVIQCDCGKKLSVRDELAGKKVKCPGCGGVVLAPTPTVVDGPTEVIAGDPPVKKTTAGDTAIASTRPKPVWADDEAKPKHPKRQSDDDDEPAVDEDDPEDKHGPHWVFPGALSTEVMALAPEGIWFASLKGEALEKALDKLAEGSRPGQVLGEKAYYIPWVNLTSIWCNRKLNGFTISYKNEGEATSKIQTPVDREARDKILKEIENYMKPDVERNVVKHTPITAMAAPIISIVVTAGITIGVAVVSLFLEGDWEGRGRGAAAAAFLNLLHWLGPLGNCGIGSITGGLMLVWMVVRMLNPPIEVTLKPVTSTAGDDEKN